MISENFDLNILWVGVNFSKKPYTIGISLTSQAIRTALVVGFNARLLEG